MIPPNRQTRCCCCFFWPRPFWVLFGVRRGGGRFGRTTYLGFEWNQIEYITFQASPSPSTVPAIHVKGAFSVYDINVNVPCAICAKPGTPVLSSASLTTLPINRFATYLILSSSPTRPQLPSVRSSPVGFPAIRYRGRASVAARACFIPGWIRGVDALYSSPAPLLAQGDGGG